MTQLQRFNTSIPALLLAVLLAACGGNNNDNGVAVNNPTTDAGSLPLLPGAPVASNNTATDGFNWINFRRAQIGLPQLTRNGLIDTAAQRHSEYQKLNGTITHDQIVGKPGFTGVKVVDANNNNEGRLKQAQYLFAPATFAFGEVISQASNSSGFLMAEELITAIYHRFVIFEPIFKEAGSGAATTTSNSTYFTTDFAANNGFGPGIGADKIAIYPFAGQTAVPVNFFSDRESPDPVPNQNEVGYPISIHANIDSFINVQAFTVRARGTASNLEVRSLTHAADFETPESAAAIVPLAKLKANTTYDVTFNGTANGVDVSRSWSFTTK
ncbi:MAG: CAP domain-containing protein [Pseudomonadota bacterium]